MKIVIFEPHPDDLLFGVGPIIFDWVEEGHEIHVITITDGRACYRATKDRLDEQAKNMTEDELAEMRINEAKKAINFIGLPRKNHHLLKFHDADGQKYVNEAIEEVNPILKGTDRIVLPSDNNSHVDHQATHDIAIKAAQDLKLKDSEYLVYFVPSYGKWNDDSKEKQIVVHITENLREKLLNWLQIYQSQKYMKFTWRMFNHFIKVLENFTFGIFAYSDMGKYHNF
ncbi:MAG: PIG-L family deacetylase [Candidatus Lokiarchaeota archaeon]